MFDASTTYVSLEQDTSLGMITLRADLASDKLKKAINEIGLGDLPAQRQIVSSSELSLGWMSPDELMLFCAPQNVADIVQTIADHLAGEHSLVVDVSDARAHFVLKGAHIREVIAKLAPVDLDPTQFDVGELRRTRFGQIAAAFWFSDQTTAHIICFRSVAAYMHEQLIRAAASGSEMGIGSEA